MAQEVQHKKVVIIGSGLAGFSAAAKFLENEDTDWHDIVVLEALNRTGGRTHSIPFRQGWIDMGE